jgi:hypothetical protein
MRCVERCGSAFKARSRPATVAVTRLTRHFYISMTYGHVFASIVGRWNRTRVTFLVQASKWVSASAWTITRLAQHEIDGGHIDMKSLRIISVLWMTMMSFAFGQSSGTSVFKVISTPNGHPTPFQNDLHAVAASSATDIWSVGQTAIHFDGSKWTAFAIPGIGGDNTSRLTGVVDFAPDNVWAVGLINIGQGNPNQVIEHFDGSAWSVATGPSFLPNDAPALESITAVSAKDVWAAGYILTKNDQSLYPLFEHYDGTSWKAVETKFQSGTIFGISADASNDAWAVGTVAFGQTFVEHFNGKGWVVVPSPNAGLGWNVLEGVVALAPNDVWAAGYYTQAVNSTRPALTLIEHFDGTSWKIVTSRNVGPNSVYQSNQFYGITAVSASDIWAFGSFFAADGSGQQATLVEHYDGTTWRIVPSPSPVDTFRADILFGGMVIPQGNVLLVGNKFGSTLAMRALGQ